MPAPTVYTEADLATYILSNAVLGPTAAALGWTAQADVQDAIDEALLDCRISAAPAATDVQVLRAYARLEAWRQAAGATVGSYRVSTDGQTFDRQQMHDHALKMLQIEEQRLEQLREGTEGAFDWAEMVTGPFSARERLTAEYLRER